MRLFISIELPEPIIKKLVQVQEHLKLKNFFSGTYVKPENLHVTLAFLGEVPEKQLPEITTKLATINFAPFLAQITHLEVNSWHSPGVLWATINSSELHVVANTITQELHIKPEHSTFRAHITLARIKQIHDKTALKAQLCSLSLDLLELSWNVTYFHLKQSQLTAQGPLYQTVISFGSTL